MIYGFLSDEALHLEPVGLTTDQDQDQGVCFATDKVKNYFTSLVQTIDGRVTRQSLFVDNSVSHYPLGKMSLLFDDSKVSNSEITLIINALNDNVGHLMNIIEYISISGGSDINNTLCNDTVKYGGYEPSSYSASSFVNVPVRVNQYTSTPPNFTTAVPRYFEFTFTYGVHTSTFKIWCDKASFLADYPLSTITAVVPPCDPSFFTDASNTYANILEAIAESPEVPTDDASVVVGNTDNTSVYKFKTRYDVSNGGTVQSYNFIFQIYYKGKQPTGMECANAVRDYLATIDSDMNIWRILIPDLFVVGIFYLIPMWDNVYNVGDHHIFKSITGWSAIKDKVSSIFPNYPSVNLENKLEIVTSSAAKFLIGVVPDEANTGTESFSSIFPSYTAVDGGTPPSVAFLDQLPGDGRFNMKLASAIGVALGSANTENLSTEIIDGRQYLVFTENYCKVYFMKPPTP
jgi:hypothetical protein